MTELLIATALGWSRTPCRSVSVDVAVWVDRGPESSTRLGGNLFHRRDVGRGGADDAALLRAAAEVLAGVGFRLTEEWSDCNGVGWWAAVERVDVPDPG